MRSSGTGYFIDRIPYARAGSGQRTLVVFPGLGDAMFDGTYPPGTEWVIRWYFSQYVGEYTVYVLSRSRNLPLDHSIMDMADDYAATIESEFGSADVLGISMGGMIGMELSIRHPDVVDRLALANSGYRIADLDAVDRFYQYAQDQDWSRIRAELSTAMFTDWRAVFYPPIALTVGRLLQPRPAVSTDVNVSLKAIRMFDATERLDEIPIPTLTFGGTDDPYFPEWILEETADGIPEATLEIVPGGKHAAFHEYKSVFDSHLQAFLIQGTNE